MAPDERVPVWQGMGSGIGSGYAWKAADKVAAYLDDQEQPEQRAEIEAGHKRLLELLGMAPDAAFGFLDLGAGAGAVAESVMTRFSGATGVLADISVPMMQTGEQKLAGFAGRFRYFEYDMNSDSWPAEIAGPFQAVVSARAIHHLSDERKGKLFQRAYDALAPGGVFVNWDLFREPSEPQKPTHPVATAEMQVELLKQAGFVSVANYHEAGRYMVFYGKKAPLS